MVHLFVYRRTEGGTNSDPPTASAGSTDRAAGAGGQPETVEPFDVSFEEVAEALSRLPRMFLEPDGSFVWVGQAEQGRWQLDGVLYDAGDRLRHVELKGRCAAAAFEQFLEALGCPLGELAFYEPATGSWLDASTARRRLAAEV